MQAKKIDGSYIVRLEIGEEVVSMLAQWVRKRRIQSGWLMGLGAVKQTTLGIYNLAFHKYEKQVFAEDHELVNMTGNIAWLDKEPVLHIHAVIADEEMKCHGGHLFSALTAVTVEVVFTPG